MALRKLCYYGNPILKKKSKDVPDVQAVQSIIDDLLETMYDAHGVGLAAVQVGELKNLFVLNITRNTEVRLREFAPDAEIYFEKVAVTPEQIEEWDLPTRPTKKSDMRSKGFHGDSVDVDAIPPNQLRDLCERCIVQHMDQETYEKSNRIEALERESLKTIVEQFARINGRHASKPRDGSESTP